MDRNMQSIAKPLHYVNKFYSIFEQNIYPEKWYELMINFVKGITCCNLYKCRLKRYPKSIHVEVTIGDDILCSFVQNMHVTFIHS